MRNALQNARILSKAVEASGWYVCLSDIHRKKGKHGGGIGAAIEQLTLNDDDAKLYNAGLPVVAFRLRDEFKEKYPHVKQQSVSTLLRVKGYIIPSTSPPLLSSPLLSPAKLYNLDSPFFFLPSGFWPLGSSPRVPSTVY